jgi:hypothetical protein
MKGAMDPGGRHPSYALYAICLFLLGYTRNIYKYKDGFVS